MQVWNDMMVRIIYIIGWTIKPTCIIKTYFSYFYQNLIWIRLSLNFSRNHISTSGPKYGCKSQIAWQQEKVFIYNINQQKNSYFKTIVYQKMLPKNELDTEPACKGGSPYLRTLTCNNARRRDISVISVMNINTGFVFHLQFCPITSDTWHMYMHHPSQ